MTYFLDALSGAIVLSGGTITLAAAETTTVNNATDTINSILAGAGTSFTKAGTGTLILGGANTYTGVTIFNAGILTGTQTSGTPFGTGGVTLNGGVLNVAPATVSGSTDISLTNAGALAINGGASITLAKGGNRSVTLTMGTSGTQFTRSNNGTLVITPTALANLGATAAAGGERLLITGTAPTNTANANLVNSPVVAQANNVGDNSGTIGDFVKYDPTNGFTSAAANYTARSVTAAFGANEITNITGTFVLATAQTNTISGLRLGAGLTLAIGSATARTLTIGNNAAVTAQIIMNGSAINGGSSTSNTLAFGASEGTVYTSGGGGTITVNITGSNGLTKFGPGSLLISNASTAYTGTTNINQGTLVLPTGGSLFVSAVNVNAGTALQFTPTANSTASAIGAISLLGTLTYNTAGNFFEVVGAANNVTGLSTNGAVTVSGGASIINVTSVGTTSAGLYLDGGLQGSGALTVNAGTNGALVLRGAASTYSGAMTVNGVASATAGTGSGLAINGPVSMSSASLTINGTLELGNSAASMGWTVLAPTTTTNINGLNSAIDALSGTGVVVANMRDITHTRTLTVGSNNGTGSFSGVIAIGAGTLNFTKVGTGTQTLSGANTYSGATTISAGTLQAGAANTLPNGAGKGNVVLDGGASAAGTLDLNGFDVGINRLSGTSNTVLGTVLNNAVATNKLLTVGNGDAAASFAGVIADGTSAVALTKTGTGAQTLSGMNTYSGATQVTGGTLTLSGSGAITNSAITINGSSAKLVQTSSVARTSAITLTQGTLDGTGAVGNVTVGSGTGGIVANGNGASNTASTLNALNFTGNSAVSLRVAGGAATATPGLTVTNTLTTSGTVSVNLTPQVAWVNGNTYNLTGYGSFTGSNSNFALGGSTALSGRQSGTFGNTGAGSGFITLTVAGDAPVWTGLNGGQWTEYPANTATRACHAL